MLKYCVCSAWSEPWSIVVRTCAVASNSKTLQVLGTMPSAAKPWDALGGATMEPGPTTTSSIAVVPLLDDSALPKEEAIPRVQLTCNAVCHTVHVRRGCCRRSQPRQILADISCSFTPGTLSALMGPSHPHRHATAAEGVERRQQGGG